MMVNNIQLVDAFLESKKEEIENLRKTKGFQWSTIAKSFKAHHGHVVSGEYLRGRFRKISQRNPTPNSPFQYSANLKDGKSEITTVVSEEMKNMYKYESCVEDKSKGTKKIHLTSDKIPTEQEIIEWLNIDTHKYAINQIYHKTSFGGKYSITVSLLAKKENNSIDFKKDFVDFLNQRNFSILNRERIPIPSNSKSSEENILIISLSDLHLEKKSFKEETEEDGNIEIAFKRAMGATKDIVCKASHGHILEKIIIIGGNDFFHISGKDGSTEKGTPLDSDNRWHLSFKKGLELLSGIIDFCKNYAKVEYITVFGNHGFQREFYLSVALDALYKKDENVKIDTTETMRKYFSYGNSAFMLSHKQPVKISSLPSIFITEKPILYANAKYRFVLTGDLHRKQQTEFISTNEQFGLVWKICPSLSSTDLWHYENNFIGNTKSCIGMIINKERGQIAEYIYNE